MTTTAPQNTLADRIKAAILSGRAPKPLPDVAPPAPMSEQRAVETLSKFADLLERLESARGQMDTAHEAIAEAGKLDLAALVEAGKPLPKLGTLRADAENLTVEVAATKSAADSMTASAGLAISRLLAVSGERLDLIEVGLRASNPLPAWMDTALVDSAIRQLPEWAAMVALRHRLTVANRPKIPAIRAEGSGLRLQDWRIVPKSEADAKRGPLGSRDAWSPTTLAAQCREYLATVEEIRGRQPDI